MSNNCPDCGARLPREWVDDGRDEDGRWRGYYECGACVDCAVYCEQCGDATETGLFCECGVVLCEDCTHEGCEERLGGTNVQEP